MKIVHISHLYHPSVGGVQTFFKNISERLVKDYGDDVSVVTTNSYYGPERKIFKKIEPSEEVINGVKVIRFPYQRVHIKPYGFMYKVFAKLSIAKPGRMVLQSNGPYSRQMKKYLMQVEADAFCASSSPYYYMQLPLWRKCNFFYYGSIHLEKDESKTVLYPAQLASMNASKLYLANTAYEKKQLEKLGVIGKKIFVLGTGVDMEPFTSVLEKEVRAYRLKLGVPEDGLLLAYVGRVEPTKNVITLIKAFEEIAIEFPGTYLLIAGSNSGYVEELKVYCEHLKREVAERIRFEVNFPIEEKALVFNALDILVLPSHNESFGLVFLEAWSCKKPVIGTSIGAVKDVISDGVDGLLMDAGNEISLAGKLKELISDKALRTSMGEKGFVKVKENYTWDIITARLRQCYVDASIS
ncbi:glycosyltransferase family 4 protein [Segetibacter aerophilus]|uniref:Glycosyl transferase family 1 domain-containing protein n=1 Tax=Segetibacter aerophilus TaxID=670293 RepID=A0A512BDA4_9BACT|nr:glycosyltransferase family 4 protein [Segetibacter aerophilus]GEO09938.1 hypothetical protein SAE01_24340 [Segetibacter aerophilus]